MNCLCGNEITAFEFKVKDIEHCGGVKGKCENCVKIYLEDLKNKRPIKIVPPKQAKMKDMTLGVCRVCNLVKTKVYYKQMSNSTSVYVDGDNKQWKGKVCPGCCTIVKRGAYKRKIGVSEKECVVCNKHFTTNQHNKLYCSKECLRVITNKQRNAKRALKPKVIRKLRKYPQSKIHCKTCNCGKSFISTMSSRIFCKPSCSPSAKISRKKTKRIRNKRCKHLISKAYKQEIIEIYNNKGICEIDHIIPLNHPEVCGLHVPWNLEPIDRELNHTKTNNWDGTMDNKLFRPWLK